MPQVNGVNFDNLPDVGYKVSDSEKKERYNANETHLIRQTPLTGVKTGIHKLTNDIFTYFPKGFKGSKNFDFYEYMSLGMVPYAIGSAMLIALSAGILGSLRGKDRTFALADAKKAGSGVVLYAIFKYLAVKIPRLGIWATTGINLDEKYLNRVIELPENGADVGIERIQYPGVYDSVQFYRKDKKEQDAVLNHNNFFYYSDKIARRAGYKGHPNASNQIADLKIRETKARSVALENINKYFPAALGVALAFQKSFSDMKISQPSSILRAIPEGFKQLWNGGERNFATKHAGKALIGVAALSTILTWLIPTITFKHKPNTMKSRVDTKKEFEVC